jgi:beta-lactamase superfamily II metal-dependent hydrolase
MKNSPKKIFKISSFNNLVVSIFVIGYRNVGESIVVLFRDVYGDVDDVKMSMVIDSYEIGDLNMTKKILSKFNVSKLDFVCWTHPHCDHSMGIDTLVKDNFHDDMVIFSPKFYFGNLSQDILSSESSKTPEIFSNITKIVEGSHNKQNIWRTISAYGDTTCQYPLKIISKDNDSSKDVYLYFLTPLGSRTDAYAIKGKELSSPNELSVSFVLSIDGYDFFFGGDIEDSHASSISEEIIKSMRWIKVPHHCSLKATKIVDRIGERLDYAVSTVYKSSGLPKEEIQNKYAQYCDLHMTQLEENNNYQIQKKYGIIQYDYYFANENTKVDITTYGNASQYFKK